MARSLKIDGGLGTAIMMLAIFATMVLLALGLPPKARMMPLMLGIPASLLALTQVIVELRRVAKETQQCDEDNTRDLLLAERLMLAWILVFFVGILSFGFVYAAPVLVFSFMYFGKKESFKTSLISGVAIWVVLLGFFQHWFEIPLFPGLVIEWLS